MWPTTPGEQQASSSRRSASRWHAAGTTAHGQGATAGALRLALVVVTLNVRYRESELDYMLNQSGARLVLTAATAGETDLRAFYDGFRSHIPTVEHLFFLDGGGAPDSYEALLADRAIEATAGPAADDPAVILYTSDTTGAPKGAVLTHAGITASAEAQAERVGTHASRGPAEGAGRSRAARPGSSGSSCFSNPARVLEGPK